MPGWLWFWGMAMFGMNLVAWLPTHLALSWMFRPKTSLGMRDEG